MTKISCLLYYNICIDGNKGWERLFEEIEIYPYHRAGNEKTKNRDTGGAKGVKKRLRRVRPGIRPILTPEALAIGFAGFFLGRAVLLGELMPFAASLPFTLASSPPVHVGQAFQPAIPAVPWSSSPRGGHTLPPAEEPVAEVAREPLVVPMGAGSASGRGAVGGTPAGLCRR